MIVKLKNNKLLKIILVRILFLQFIIFNHAMAFDYVISNNGSCIDYDKPHTWSTRVAIGFSYTSFEDAEKLAKNNLRSITTDNPRYYSRCSGDPILICEERFKDDNQIYHVDIRFACPNDKGVYVKESKSKSFKFETGILPHNEGLNRQEITNLLTKEMEHVHDNVYFHERYEKECKQDYNKNVVPSFKWKENDLVYGGGPHNTDQIYRANVAITCNSTQKTTIDVEAIKSAKDSPDPKINWMYEKWWSSKSFDKAKQICDKKVAEKNRCRFRGGPVDITYKNEKSAFYWVSLRYRCRYD